MSITKNALLLSLLVLLVSACTREKPYEAELKMLDDAIEHSHQFTDKKEAKIAALKQRMARDRQPEEQYWLNKELYDELKDYDADSAFIYAGRNIRLAIRLGKKDYDVLWRIEQASLLIKTGRLDEASTMLKDIQPQTLSHYGRMQYYAQLLSLNMAHSYYIENMGTDAAHRSEYFNLALRYRDSTMAYVTPDIPEYLNITAWQDFDKEQTDSVKKALISYLKTAPLNNAEDGVGAYMLSQIYREEGNRDLFIRYLALSALSYVRSGNRNFSSEAIQDLSAIMLREDKNVSRAYNYITYCTRNLTTFRNRAHIVRIRKLQDEIATAYDNREQTQKRIETISLAVISLLAIILIAAIVYIYRQMRRLHISRQQLAEANQKLNAGIKERDELNARIGRRNKSLSELNENLAAVNSSLQETSAVKEKYIGYVFALCSEFIEKIDQYRKTCNRKLRAGQHKELAEFLASTTILQQELKSFYEGFDDTFLQLYPDFITQLNTLMQPGQELKQREANRLGTDLRILALMRLGFTDCNRIADFLHCSVQSVYNSRRSIYARLAITPKEFKERITNIGTLNNPT